MTTTPESAISFGIAPPAYRLSASMRIGRVRLAVSSLERSLAFYRDAIGLFVLDRTESTAVLGVAGRVLLELHQQPGLRPLGHSTRLGLYHTAFLLPTRSDLAAFVQHLRRHRVPFAASDHLVSEALYLVDPDGLTVEVYTDRDPSLWTAQNGQLVMATLPLQFDDLPPVPPDAWRGAPSGTVVGHMHLYIGDLDRAAAFYHAALGLSITTAAYPGALFLSAGGYHHHLGLNTWAAGSPVASASDPRLLSWEILLPSPDELRQAVASFRAAGFEPDGSEPDGFNPAGAATFIDPWKIALRLRVAE
jgi:catechol 2,3-dioxygenase